MHQSHLKPQAITSANLSLCHVLERTRQNVPLIWYVVDIFHYPSTKQFASGPDLFPLTH